jgi:hypothetical protein|tara:strand:+ start:55838 stop:56701 length:864 start_codon:yes stop_codon:yes gene_type:complete
MSRNNDERSGALPSAEAPLAVAAAQQQNNSIGLNFVVPTEHVELPSKGQFYPDGHPLHNEETLEIKHMTAKEEDILTSRTLLKKGLAVDRLLQSIIVNKKINPDDLFVGDKNAVIVSARQSAYGDEYSTKVTCQVCSETSDFAFNLSDSCHIHPDDTEDAEFVMTESGTFDIKLPKTGFTAEVRLLNGKDEKWLAKSMEQKKKARVNETTLTDQMRLFIVSVNGIKDREEINGFINVMPAADSRHMRNVYKQLSPNIDLTQDFLCSACGAETKMEVPFTADFFWPKQ